jgi:lysophospholipase L1-like esterase
MDQIVRKLGVLLVVSVAAGIAAAQDADVEKSPCNPQRWAEAIAKFEAADKIEPPRQRGIVFVGSSSIRMWKLQKSFPDLPIVNRGFGGSEICDSLFFFDTLVAKHRPKVVVFYAGDNDIAAGKSAKQVLADFRSFVKLMKEKLPEARLVYIAIKPSIARWELAGEMVEANRRIAAACETDKRRLGFVDVWGPMLSEDGKPRKELFLKDGLHLNEAGYRLWTKLVQKHLESNEQ